MKSAYRRLIITFLFLLIAIKLHGDANRVNDIENNSYTIIEGNIPLGIGEISLDVYNYYNQSNIDLKRFATVQKINNGHFHFIIHENSDVYIRLKFSGSKLDPECLLFIKPGSRLNFNFTTDTYSCIGLGSENVNVQLKVWNINKIDSDTSRSLYGSLDYFDKFYDSLHLVKDSILRHEYPNKQLLIYKILSKDIEAEWRMKFLHMFTTLRYFNTDSSDKKNIDKFYKKYYLNLNIDFSDTTATILSRNFLDFVYRKILCDFVVKNKVSRTDFSSIYHEITNLYTGKIRDKLLANLFIDKFDSDNTASLYLDSALSIVGKDIYGDLIRKIKKTRAPGALAYNFSLPDSAGKIHTLSSFKDRVVVVDFWFTGCFACSQLNKVMDPIRSKYKNVKDIIFVSVSVDKDRKVWLKSLRNNEYTSNNEVNLFTSELGLLHPLIKFYEIAGFPQMIIIDKSGMIASANPILPIDEGSANNFCEMLNVFINRNGRAN